MATIRQIGRCKCGYNAQAAKRFESCPKCQSEMSWGAWLARVTHNGVTTCKSFPLKKDAEAYLSLCTINKRQGIPLPSREPDLSFTDAVKEFRKALDLEVKNKQIKDSTRQFYLDCLPKLTEYFSMASLLSITVNHVNEYLSRRDVSDTRKRHELITLMRVYGVQTDGQTALTRPLLLAKVQELKQCHKPRVAKFSTPKFLTDAQTSALRDAAKQMGGQWPLLLDVALQTGMRKSNVLNLQWSWINWSERTITVPASHSKSNQEMIIPICDELRANLRHFRKQVGHRLSVFDKTNFRKQWKRLTASCNISANFHRTRHTFVVNGLESGVDLHTMSELAGHSDIAITKNIYGKLSLDHKRAAIERMQKERASG